MHSSWNDKALVVLQEMMHCHTLIHSPVQCSMGGKALHHIITLWLSAFPDIQYTQRAITAAENTVFIHWECKGTHLGEFYSVAATGKSVHYCGYTQLQLHQEKIIAYRAHTCMHRLITQIIEIKKTSQIRYQEEREGLYAIVARLMGVPITHRQIECMALLMLNMSIKEIARVLLIEVSTVYTHLKRVGVVICASNRSGIMEYIKSQHLIEIFIRIGLILRKKHEYGSFI